MRRLTLFLAFSAACTATACEAPTRLAGWNARQLKMDVRVIDEGSLAVDVYVLDDRKHVLSCPTARDDLHVFIDDAELSVDPGGWYTSSEEYVSTRGCRPWSARVFRPGELPMETGVPSILSLEDDDSLVEFEVPGLRSPQIVHYTGRDGGLLRPGADMEMHFDEPWTPILDWREPRINLDTDQYNYTVTLTDPGVEQLDDGYPHCQR